LSILRINLPKFGGGLKFETDDGIGQKGAFCNGLAFRESWRISSQSPNTFFLSEILYPNARIILRFVSILQGMPCSIRVMVIGDMLAFLASSALLIIRDSLISFNKFLLI
jgi:hypothetical protein